MFILLSFNLPPAALHPYKTPLMIWLSVFSSTWTWRTIIPKKYWHHVYHARKWLTSWVNSLFPFFICSHLILVSEARNGRVVGLGVSTNAGGYFHSLAAIISPQADVGERGSTGVLQSEDLVVRFPGPANPLVHVSLGKTLDPKVAPVTPACGCYANWFWKRQKLI